MVKKKSDAPRQHIRLMEKSFQKTLLDAPLKRKRKSVPGKKGIFLESLPQSLQPTPYVPPQPVPPPRRKNPFLFLELKKPEYLILECID